MFYALPKTFYFNSWLSTLPPDDLSGFPEPFLMVRECYEVLEGCHRTPGGELVV